MITDSNTDVPLSGSGLPLEITNQIASLASRYIDLSAVSAGTGTIASPFTFAQAKAEMEALAGDQGGISYLFLRGSSVEDSLAMASVENFSIGAYGTGAKPIFSGAVPLNDTWTFDGTYWFITGQVDLTTIFVRDSPVASNHNDIKVTQMVNKTDVTTGYKSWFGETDRIYAVFNGIDPNTLQLEITDASSVSVIKVQSARNVTISDIEVIKGFNDCLTVDAIISNVSILNNSLWFGRVSNFSVINVSANPKSTGVVISGNESAFALNTALETGWMDGALIENNNLHDCGMGLELWHTTINSTIRNNTISDIDRVSQFPVNSVKIGHGNSVWLTHSNVTADAGFHDNNTFTENVFRDTRGIIVDIQSGKNNVFDSNWIYVADPDNTEASSLSQNIRVHDPDGDAAVVNNTFTNNKVVQRYRHGFIQTFGSATNAILNNNQYYSEDNSFLSWMRYHNVPYGSVASDVLVTGAGTYVTDTGQDANSSYGDPGVPPS